MSLPTYGWKNKVGTAGRSCKCGSWKQHWINFSGEKWPTFCSVSGCREIAEVGAHIYNTSDSAHGEYIVPACKWCNARTSTFSLRADVVLVSANKQMTCER